MFSRHLFASLFPPVRLAFLEAFVIGLVSGVAAVLLKVGVGSLGTWRVHVSQDLPAIAILPAIGLIGGYLAGLLVENIAPEAAGTGISPVKAMLARVPAPSSLRVAVVKLISTILVVGSGFTLGRQGPTVQIGAVLAEWFSRRVPTSPDYRRQTIAAGAAAGLAAGFNAPITGVLFVVEELLRDVSGLTLGTAILASFVGAVVSRLLGGSIDWELQSELTQFQVSFSAIDIPFMVVLGAFVGLVAGVFNLGVPASVVFVRRFVPLSLPLRIGLAGLLSGAIAACLPISFRDNMGLWEFLSTDETSLRDATIAFLAKFVLTWVACATTAPGGLFAPSLVMGSALGAIVALCSQALFGIGEQTTYALAGMGAFFSAVAKVPITAIVIVFEITTDFNLVLPLMITSLMSYLVAEKVAKGSLYNALLEIDGIQVPDTASDRDVLATLTAADVMQRQVETLDAQLTLDGVRLAFSRSHHRGFPVVEAGKLVGIISQSDLPDLNPAVVVRLREIMTPQPVTVHPTDTLSNVLFQLNRYHISRLPVTDGRRLVGIITRTDIIRAEIDGMTGLGGGQKISSYGVYQTRAPEIGRGRLLVPIANPDTAPILLRMASAIARELDYELECLQVILVSRHTVPSEMPVETQLSRRLLKQAERIGAAEGISVHTQIRVAHEVADAVLDVIRIRHINLLIVGWKGLSFTPDRVFGDTVDKLLRQASCDAIAIKFAPGALGKSASPLNRWLVPMGGGPNAKHAVSFLPALASLSPHPDIHLCQVFAPEDPQPDKTMLQEAQGFLQEELDCPVIATPLFSPSVTEATIELSRLLEADAIVLGASRKGFLQQAIEGNIPNAIVQGCRCTAILFRSAAS
jgi:chloride channel protein, CIC family